MSLWGGLPTCGRLPIGQLIFLLLAAGASAHDIPNDVTVQMFVRPAGDKLNLLVRVPLQAMRDIDFRSREAGYLDLARATELLPGAATLWISDFVELYENVLNSESTL